MGKHRESSDWSASSECTSEGQAQVEKLQHALDRAHLRGFLWESELIEATRGYNRGRECIDITTHAAKETLRILTLGAEVHYWNAVVEEVIGAQTLLDLSEEGAIQIDLGLKHALSERAANNVSDTIYVQLGTDKVFHRVSWYEFVQQEIQQRLSILPWEVRPVVKEIPILTPKLTAEAKKRIWDFERVEKLMISGWK